MGTGLWPSPHPCAKTCHLVLQRSHPASKSAEPDLKVIRPTVKGAATKLQRSFLPRNGPGRTWPGAWLAVKGTDLKLKRTEMESNRSATRMKADETEAEAVARTLKGSPPNTQMDAKAKRRRVLCTRNALTGLLPPPLIRLLCVSRISRSFALSSARVRNFNRPAMRSGHLTLDHSPHPMRRGVF